MEKLGILIIDESKYRHFYEKTVLNDFEVFYADPPSENEEEYLMYLVGEIKRNNICAVFSFSYFRFISLACNIVQLPYICWLIGGYSPDNFDYTVRNEYNYIFCADIDTWDILKTADVKHVEYMPAGPTSHDLRKDVPHKDILIVSDDIQELNTVSFALDPLKDSSKGYLDGMMNSRKTDLRQRDFFANLAVYVRDEIVNYYPLEDNDLEPIAHKYDYRFLLPMSDYKAVHMMIYHLTAEWKTKDYHIDVLINNPDALRLNRERLSYYTRDEFEKPDSENSIFDYKIVVVFPSVLNSNMLTNEMYDIMTGSSVLILPGYVNNKILKESGVPFFRNRMELDHMIDEYMENEDLRKEKAADSNSYTASLDTFNDRFNGILYKVLNKE